MYIYKLNLIDTKLYEPEPEAQISIPDDFLTRDLIFDGILNSVTITSNLPKVAFMNSDGVQQMSVKIQPTTKKIQIEIPDQVSF